MSSISLSTLQKAQEKLETVKTLITTMAVYYGLPSDFNAAIYDANSLLKQLRRQLRKIARRLSLDKHPILD